jgi:hypothetical protein
MSDVWLHYEFSRGAIAWRVDELSSLRDAHKFLTSVISECYLPANGWWYCGSRGAR